MYALVGRRSSVQVQLFGQSAFDAVNSLMSVRCLSEPLMWIWALQQNILMGRKHSRNRHSPVVLILSANSHQQSKEPNFACVSN